MSNLPEVSILIPAKNAEQTLHIAIEDATQQEGVDWRIIIANDHSTDGTLDLIRSYQEHFDQIQVVDVPLPGGIAAGRNRLLEAVQTPYLAWLDADDGWPRRDKLIRQIQFLEKYPEYALVGDGKVRGVFLENLKQKNFRFPLSNDDIQVRLLFKNAFIMSSILGRTEKVKSIRFRPEMEYLEDYVWVQEIAKEHKVANMVLGGTLHFISAPKKQKEKDATHQVYEKEAQILSRELTQLGLKMDDEDAAFLADFARRNRKLDHEQSGRLKHLINSTIAFLLSLGYPKDSVKGFFWDIQMRRLKCRWFLR